MSDENDSTRNPLGFTHGSWITSVSYDIKTKALTVNTKNDSYELQGVSLETYLEFEKAPSKGRYFNANLKGRYDAKLFS